MRQQFLESGSIGVVKDLSPHRLAGGAWSEARHVRFLSDGARSMMPDKEVHSAAPIQPLWLGQFPPLNDPIWVYANNSAFYSYQGSAGTHLSLGSGFAAAGERWQGFVFQGIGVFNQVNNIPQRLAPIAHGGALANLDNWATNPAGVGTRVKALRPYRNFLVAVGLVESGVEKPFRVRWSDAAEPGTMPASWDLADPANLAGEFDLAETSDEVVDGLVLGDSFLVYKERSIWGVQFVGGQNVMRNWKITTDAGLLARDCVVSFPGGHAVATQDDFVIHQGIGNTLQSVIKDKMRSWLQRNINALQVKNAFLCTNHPRKEVWFFFPTSGETYANMVLVWSWEENKVSLREISPCPFASPGSVKPNTGPDLWSSGF